VLSQLAILPTGQPFVSANPKRSIARDEEFANKVAGKMLVPWRLPQDAANAIEAKQAEFRAQPEITVGRLRDRLDGAVGKAFADLPRGVRVLIDMACAFHGGTILHQETVSYRLSAASYQQVGGHEPTLSWQTVGTGEPHPAPDR